MQGRPLADPRRRLLLVDDDKQVCRALARVLQGLGYVADVAPDGATAILMATAHAYDVVLTDLVMPQLDGMELMLKGGQMGPPDVFERLVRGA